MDKKYLILGLVFLLCVSFVSATDFRANNDLYFSLDNGDYSGSTIFDLSDNQNGTNFGATPGVAGHINEAFDLEASQNDYITSNTSMITVGSAFTVSTWVRPESLTLNTNGIATTIITNTNRDGFTFGHHSSAGWRMVFFNSNSGVINEDEGSVTATINKWYHIVLTYDGLTAKMYVNGSNILTGTGAITTHDTDLVIGRQHTVGTTLDWDGRIDEFGIWSYVMTPSQVSELFTLTENPYVNTIPNITQINVSPNTITKQEELKCNFTVYDRDNDNLNASVTWYVNTTRNTTYDYTFTSITNTNGSGVNQITTSGTGSFIGTLINNTDYSCQVNITDGTSNYVKNSSKILSNIGEISINIIYPLDGTHYNTTSLPINYTIENTTAIGSCWWTRDEGVINTSTTCINSSITGQTWDEGNNTVTIYSNDTSSNLYNDSVTFYIDTGLPNITIHSPNADNSSWYYNVTSVGFNITFQDANLYGYNITCKNSTGDIVFTDEKINITTSTYNYSNSSLFSSLGIIMCKVLASDDHTDINWSANITEKRKYFLFGKRNRLNINREVEIGFIEDKNTKIDYITHEKKLDRVSPIIKIASETIYRREGIFKPRWVRRNINHVRIRWLVRYDGTAYKRNSEYEGHVIIHPNNKLEEAYWVDAEDKYNSTITTEIFDDYILYTSRVPVGKLIRDGLFYKTDSLGGLNFNSKNVSFLIKQGQNVSFNGYNSWNSSNILTNLTVSNGTNTTTYYDVGNKTIAIGCEETTIVQSSNNYMNSYTMILKDCDDPLKYNNPFWQSKITITTRNNFTNDIITGTSVQINDSSITNISTATNGSISFYVNNNTYSMIASKSGYNDSNTNISTFAFNTTNSLNLFLDRDVWVTFIVYNERTNVIVPANITIDLLNSENPYTKSIIAVNGTSANTLIKEGIMRVTFYGTGYDSNTIYYNFTESNYTVSLYITNSTSQNFKDVLLKVTDELSNPLEVADISIYAQNSSSSYFYLVTQVLTNIDGEREVTLVKDSLYYKFTIFYDGEKCYETENGAEFPISNADDEITFRCILSNDYDTIRDGYNRISGTLSSTATSNITGYFSLEASGDTGDTLCLQVEKRNYATYEIINESCSTGSFIYTHNVNASGLTKDTTYRATFIGYPSGQTIEKSYNSVILVFLSDPNQDWGNFGLLLTILIIIVLSFAVINRPTLVPVAAGFGFMVSTVFNFVKIGTFGNTANTISGISVFFIMLLITIVLARAEKSG